MRSYTIDKDGIKLTIDFRTELLGIIQLIGDYKKKYPSLIKEYCNKEYRNRIFNKFSFAKDHKAVLLYDELVEKHGMGYDAPVNLFLQLDENYKCKKVDDYIFIERLDCDKKVYDLIDSIYDFVKLINFEEYYRNNKDEYLSYLKLVNDVLNINYLKKYIADYYGYIKGEFVINLLPYQTNGNYGVTNKNTVYANICIKENEENKLLFFRKGTEYFLQVLIFHEFSHSYINSLTEKHKNTVLDLKLFDEKKEIMKGYAYDGVETILNETIIIASSIRYLENSGYHDKALILLEKEREMGFYYIDNVINSLIYYENNRNQYPNIDAFFPIILNNVKSEFEKKKRKK